MRHYKSMDNLIRSLHRQCHCIPNVKATICAAARNIVRCRCECHRDRPESITRRMAGSVSE
jgi:hypothetical protein